MNPFLELYSTPTFIKSEKNFLSKEEINKILQDIAPLPYETGLTFDDDETFVSRKSQVKWIPTQNFEWLYGKIYNFVHILNSDNWRFKLKPSPELIQYTEYDSSYEGNYDWHVDIGDLHSSHRKISVTIQLSDSNEYEGGLFQVFSPKVINNKLEEILVYPKDQGSAIIFPSYTPHRVTPVTKGNRKSLVLWLGGCSFR